MTREEIIEHLDSIVGTYEILLGNGINSDILDVDDIEAIKEAISALSENKGDLISRQAVENITWEEPSYSDPLNVLTEVREKVRALPSVENKGEWILDETDNSVTCKTCGCSIYPNDISNGEPHFCPNCGADMRKAEKPETCKGCLEPCIMYEPDMRACKKKVREVIE